jgi:hypothetical protein
MIRHRYRQRPSAPIDSRLASEHPPAIAEPNDAAIRSAHEIAPLHLTLVVGREDEVVTVEREGEFQVAGDAEPAVGGAEIDGQLLDIVGCARGRDDPPL